MGAARSLAGLAIAMLLVGCAAVGPDYHAPPLPAGLAERPSATFAEAGSPALSQAPLPAQWWRLYDDPRLDALIGEALAANTDLRVAAATLDRARAVLREAGAAAGVQTSIDGGFSVGETSAGGVGPATGVHDRIDAGIGISYDVDVVGRIRRAVEAARADADAQAAAADLARTVVVAGVVGAYGDACASGARLEVARRSVALQRRSLALTERGARAGLYPPLDAVRSRALLAQLESALPPLDGARRTALYRLAVLTGRAPADFPADLANCAHVPALRQPLPVGDGAALIRRRPDIRQAERHIAAATADIGVATADLYPSISLGASAGTTSRSVGHLLDSSAVRFSIGPVLSWRFPNVRVARARIEQASAVQRGVLASFDGVVLNALREAESALTVYVRDLEENAGLRAARDENRTAAALQNRLARGGTVSSLAALDVERTLAAAESALAASDAVLASDRVRIFLALGGGWEEGAAAPSSAGSP